MDISGVDALLDAFGPFLLPVALFAAGVVGYGVLFLVGRLMTTEGTDGTDGTDGWPTGPSEATEEPTDPDRHEG
jgi:hypothetical protein